MPRNPSQVRNNYYIINDAILDQPGWHLFLETGGLSEDSDHLPNFAFTL